MGDGNHSLTVAFGVVSVTVATPSAVVALTALGMVCATAIAIEYIKSSPSKN